MLASDKINYLELVEPSSSKSCVIGHGSLGGTQPRQTIHMSLNKSTTLT